MKLAFEDESAWRKRGRPRREVPAEIAQIAERVYREKKIGRLVVGPGEEKEARELIFTLRRWARNEELDFHTQRDGTMIRWRITDRKGPK